MKTLKSLFMLCAGLSFCACSSDNDNVLPEGSGKVVVRIAPPASTRTPIADFSENDQDKDVIVITGNYTITLDAAAGGGTRTNVVPAADGTAEVTFNNVQYPKSVTVIVNDAKSSYTIDDLTTIGSLDAKSVPAYGYTPVADFTSTSEDNVTTYLAKVNMCIPVARLEIGNITFNASTFFSSLTTGGVYMDKLRPSTEYNYTKGSESFVGATSKGDYQFVQNGNGFGEVYKLGDEVSVDLKANAAKLPASGAYAYNFFGGTDVDNNPQFKIWFSSSQNANDNAAVERWAIMNFQKGGVDIALENGKIYQVTSATLADANIVGDEENDMTYVVNVEVKEATWTIEPIDGVWEQ